MSTPKIYIAEAKVAKFFEIVKLEGFGAWTPWAKVLEVALGVVGIPHRAPLLLTPKNLMLLYRRLKGKVKFATNTNRAKVLFAMALKDQYLNRAKLVHVNRAKAIVEANTGYTYRPYQTKGSRWLCKNRKGLLADQVGLGKTGQILTAILARDELKGVRHRVLVVGSVNACSVWLDEVGLWCGDRYTVREVKSRQKFRYPEEGEVVVCTWGMLPGTTRRHGGKRNEDTGNVRGGSWTCMLPEQPPEGMLLFGDEIHAVKNPKAKRTVQWTVLRESVEARGGDTFGATATPLENNPGDLWNVLVACGVAEQCFHTFDTFRELFGGTYGYYGLEWPQQEVHPAVPELLRHGMLRREQNEVRDDMPDTVTRFIDVTVKRNDPVWAVLDEFEAYLEERGLTLEEFIDLAVAGGGESVPFELVSKVRAACAMAKTSALLEYVKDAEENKDALIVMCSYRDPLAVLSKRTGWETIQGGISAKKRAKISQEFREGKLLGVACTIRAANEACTLTASNRMLFVDQDWNHGKNTQARGRNNRYGQKAPVLYYDILRIRNSIDQVVQEILRKKVEWAEQSGL